MLKISVIALRPLRIHVFDLLRSNKRLSSIVLTYFKVLICPNGLHSLPVWILMLCIFHKRQKSRYYLLLSFIKVSFAYKFKGTGGYFSDAVF